MVALEAAVHGVPSLLSSVVPAAELLPGACATFQADDVNQLARSLERLLDEPGYIDALRSRLAAAIPSFYSRDLSWGSKLVALMLDGRRENRQLP